MMPRSFVCGLALIQCRSWVLPLDCVRLSVLATAAFLCDKVKLTRANLFISNGELYVRDHSNTPFVHSIMSFRVLCALLKSLLLANNVVSSTNPTMRSFGLLLLAMRMRGALYIAYSSIESGHPWQHPFSGKNGVDMWASNLSCICCCVRIMSM